MVISSSSSASQAVINIVFFLPWEPANKYLHEVKREEYEDFQRGHPP